MTGTDETSEADTLAQLARLIYDEMNVEPRQMHDAIEIAREQLKQIRDLLVKKGVRRSSEVDLTDIQ